MWHESTLSIVLFYQSFDHVAAHHQPRPPLENPRYLPPSTFPSLSSPLPSSPPPKQGHSPFWKPRSGPPGRSHDQTVALILAGEIHYPRSIGPIAKSLIRDLLDPVVESRLGCRPASPASSSSSSGSSGPSATSSSAAVAAGKKTEAGVAAAAAAAAQDTARRSSTTARGLSWSSGPPAAAPGGWQSVKQHGFFKDMDWEALLRGEIAAPIKPAGVGRGMVGNFAREYTRQRAGWGGDQQELRDVAEKEGLFKRELMGFDFVRD